MNDWEKEQLDAPVKSQSRTSSPITDYGLAFPYQRTEEENKINNLVVIAWLILYECIERKSRFEGFGCF